MTATRELVFPDAVEGAQDLFNRDQQVAAIKDALLRPARRTVVLLGARLLGKTSVLNVVTNWAEDQASYIVVRLAHAGSREEFMAEIVHGIHDRVGADRSTTRELFGRDATHTTTVARFVKTVQGLTGRAPRARFLLCVDELDSLLQGCTEETARQLLDLLLYLTEQARLPIRFLFTMSRIPVEIRLSYGSPFLNQATIMELRPWSATEAREFADWLVGERHQLDEPAHAALFAAAGGHPYFTKAVLSALVTAAEPTTIGSAVQAATRSREVDIALSNIVGAYLPAGAVAVLDRVADSPAGLPAANLREAAPTEEVLERLTDAGMLSYESRRYFLRLGLWRQWRGERREGGHRPGRLVRFARALRRFAGGRSAWVALPVAGLLLLALAVGPQLLFPDRSMSVASCGGSAQALHVQVSYPSYISTGDEYELRVSVTNERSGSSSIDGYVVVDFPAGGPGSVTKHTDTGITFEQLRPGEQRTQVVAFTHTQPGRLLPETGTGVPVELRIHAEGADCSTERWSLSIAPLPYLKKIRNGALGLVLLLPAPVLIESLVHRVNTRRDRG